MANYIIYHEVKPGTACPDGIMAAAIALLKFPDAQLVGDSYKHESEYGDRPWVEGLPILEAGDRLIIVDFSYPASWLHYWESLGVQVILIDHHAPKFPMLAGFSGAILDENECGATLAWKHFFPNEPQPEILKHVRRRDIGADGYYKADENCRDSKAITAAMGEMRYRNPDHQIELCTIWLSWESDEIKTLQIQGENILREEEEIAQTVAAEAFESELCGHKCGKIQLKRSEDKLTSQIGNLIARQHPEWNFAWLVSSDGKSNSLRSANGFDVSAVARQMGGDGHKAAAGFQAII